MTNEEALAKARELYELVTESVTGFGTGSSEKYLTLRSEIRGFVGLDGLPSFVRNGRTLRDSVACATEVTQHGTNAEVRAALRQNFAAMFDTLEGGARQALPVPKAPEPTLDVFISHSSVDKALADAIVALLRLTMLLRPEQIRCTSVEGTGLAGGVRFEDRLREEIAASRVFIALITPALLRSHFSLFELGARWGLDVFGAGGGVWMPVVARGIARGKVPAPL